MGLNKINYLICKINYLLTLLLYFFCSIRKDDDNNQVMLYSVLLHMHLYGRAAFCSRI